MFKIKKPSKENSLFAIDWDGVGGGGGQNIIRLDYSFEWEEISRNGNEITGERPKPDKTTELKFAPMG